MKVSSSGFRAVKEEIRKKPQLQCNHGFIQSIRLNFKLETRNLKLFLECLDDVAGADAAGADLDALDAAVSKGLYLLEIRVPGSFGFIVGVAHVIPEARAFSAYFAYL